MKERKKCRCKKKLDSVVGIEHYNAYGIAGDIFCVSVVSFPPFSLGIEYSTWGYCISKTLRE